MGLGNQRRQLERQAADFRQQLFGTDASGVKGTGDYNRGEFTGIECYYSPFKHQQRTEEAGTWARFDTVVRVPKATAPAKFVPELNKQWKLTEQAGTESKEFQLTITALGGTHASSAEWILGCMALNAA
jgi:hypothetical protein